MSVLENYLPTEVLQELAPTVEEVKEEQEQEVNVLAELVSLYETVSEEAFSVGDVSDYLKRRSAVIQNTFANAFKRLTTFDHRQPDTLDTSAINRYLNTMKYTDASELTIYIPVGFRGNMDIFVNDLMTNVMPLMGNLLVGVIGQTRKCFAHYINNSGDANDSALVYTPTIKTETLEAAIATVAKYFVVGNRRATADFGECYDNLRQVAVVNSNVNLINQTLWRQVNPRMVESEVEKVTTLSSKLFGILDSEDAKVSADFVKGLVGLLNDVGSFISFYSAFNVKMRELTTALKMNENIYLK